MRPYPTHTGTLLNDKQAVACAMTMTAPGVLIFFINSRHIHRRDVTATDMLATDLLARPISVAQHMHDPSIS